MKLSNAMVFDEDDEGREREEEEEEEEEKEDGGTEEGDGEREEGEEERDEDDEEEEEEDDRDEVFRRFGEDDKGEFVSFRFFVSFSFCLCFSSSTALLILCSCNEKKSYLKRTCSIYFVSLSKLSPDLILHQSLDQVWLQSSSEQTSLHQLLFQFINFHLFNCKPTPNHLHIYLMGKPIKKKKGLWKGLKRNLSRRCQISNNH